MAVVAYIVAPHNWRSQSAGHKLELVSSYSIPVMALTLFLIVVSAAFQVARVNGISNGQGYFLETACDGSEYKLAIPLGVCTLRSGLTNEWVVIFGLNSVFASTKDI